MFIDTFGFSSVILFYLHLKNNLICDLRFPYFVYFYSENLELHMYISNYKRSLFRKLER